MKISKDSMPFQFKEQCILKKLSYTNIGLGVIRFALDVALHSKARWAL